MKKLALAFLAVTISTLSFAQGKYGATPEDSVVCIESLIYKDYMKSDPALALSLWKKASILQIQIFIQKEEAQFLLNWDINTSF